MLSVQWLTNRIHLRRYPRLLGKTLTPAQLKSVLAVPDALVIKSMLCDPLAQIAPWTPCSATTESTSVPERVEKDRQRIEFYFSQEKSWSPVVVACRWPYSFRRVSVLRWGGTRFLGGRFTNRADLVWDRCGVWAAARVVFYLVSLCGRIADALNTDPF